jgi:hypothetical protein
MKARTQKKNRSTINKIDYVLHYSFLFLNIQSNGRPESFQKDAFEIEEEGVKTSGRTAYVLYIQGSNGRYSPKG